MFKLPVNDEKGQAVIEMTIVLMLLLILTFGLVNWGLIFYSQFATNQGARFGARYAAVHTVSDADLKALIAEKSFPGQEARFSDEGDTNDDGYIDIIYTDLDGGNKRQFDGEVTITVAYPVTVAAPFLSIMIGKEKWVESTVTMRIEN